MLDSLGRRWDPALHPRDRKGRFIRTFRKVRLFDPGTSEPWGVGKVENIVDENHIKVTVTALNQNVPSNHQIGEHVNAPANGLESVNDIASIHDAENAGANRAALLPTKEDISTKGKQWGFSDAEIAEAHAVVDGNNDGNPAGKYLVALTAYNRSRTQFEPDSQAQRNGRTGTEASRTRFIQTLDELGVDQGKTDDTPDGLSGIQPLLDDYNSSRAEALPDGWKEELPIDLDRQFKNSNGDVRGFASQSERVRSDESNTPDSTPVAFDRPRGGAGFDVSQHGDSISSLLSPDPAADNRQTTRAARVDAARRSNNDAASESFRNDIHDLSTELPNTQAEIRAKYPDLSEEDVQAVSIIKGNIDQLKQRGGDNVELRDKNINDRIDSQLEGRTGEPFDTIRTRLDAAHPARGGGEQTEAPTTESTPTPALAQDDVAAEIESVFNDGETTLAPDERADLIGGYYMERGNDGKSTIYDANGDEVSSLSDTASDEQIQRASADVAQHSESNAVPAADNAPDVTEPVDNTPAPDAAPNEQTDAPTPEPEPPLSDQDVQDTINDWTDGRDPNTSREQVVNDRLQGTEVSDENRQALLDEARSRDQLDSDPQDQRDPAARDRAARDEVDAQDAATPPAQEPAPVAEPTPAPEEAPVDTTPEQTDAPTSSSDISSYTDEELNDFIIEHRSLLNEGGLSRADERKIESDLTDAQNERNAREDRANAPAVPDAVPAEQTNTPAPPDDAPQETVAPSTEVTPEQEQTATDAVAAVDALPDDVTPEEALPVDTAAVNAIADIEQIDPEAATRITETRAQQNRNNFREFTPRGQGTPASGLLEGENPADTSLLQHMHDEQGMYRWHERGADAGTKMRIGDDIFFAKGDKVYKGKILDMKTHSQPAVYFMGQDGKPHWVHVDRVFKDHGVQVNEDGSGAVIPAPEGLSQQQQIDHFIDSFAQTDNSGNFGILKANGGKFQLSNGYTLETGQRRGLILKDPDGNVVDRSFRVQGGLDEHKYRFFDNQEQLVDKIDTAVNNNEAAKQDPQTTAPAPDQPSVPEQTPTTTEPQIAQERTPSSPNAVGPDAQPVPDLPTNTPEQVQAFDSTTLTAADLEPVQGAVRLITSGPDGYDPNIVRDGTILELPTGYHAVRNDGWDIYSPDGGLADHLDDIPGEGASGSAGRMWLSAHEDRVRRATGSNAITPEPTEPGGSAGYFFDTNGDSDELVNNAQLSAAATEAVRFLDANPGVGTGIRLPLPGGYQVSKNADGSIKITHPDTSILGANGRTLSRAEFTNLMGSPDLNTWLAAPRTYRNRRRVNGENPEYQNLTLAEAEPQFSAFLDDIGRMPAPGQVFNANQPVVLGNFTARRNRNNDGWRLFNRDGSDVASLSDVQANPASRDSILGALRNFHQPPTPDPTVPLVSEPWTEGEPAHANNFLAEASQIPRVNGRPSNSEPIPILDGRYTMQYLRSGVIVTNTADGHSLDGYVTNSDNNGIANSIARVVNQHEHRRLTNIPISPTPEEVWGRPNPDQAATIGGRVRINETGEMGFVESLTPTGLSAIVRTDSGELTTRRLTSLTGFAAEDLDESGMNPNIPLFRTRRAARSLRNIPNADKMDEWLTRAADGSLTYEDRSAIKKMLQDAQDAVDMPSLNGYRAKIHSIDNYNGKIVINVNYYDANNSIVGNSNIDWVKDGGKLIAHHGFMSLNDSTQGKKLSEISNSVFENLYRYNGVAEVNTQANITIGTYAWALLGFGWDPNNFDYGTVERMRSRIDSKGVGLDISQDERQRMSDWTANLARMRSEMAGRTPTRADFERYDIPSPNDLAMWGRSNSTGAKPGKDALIFSGISWYASADLPNIPFTEDLVQEPNAAPNGLVEGQVTTGETVPGVPGGPTPDVPGGDAPAADAGPAV